MTRQSVVTGGVKGDDTSSRPIGMTFLEAQRVLRSFKGGSDLPFLLAMSGTSGQLELFLRAHAARRGFIGKPRHLSFGTLMQAILGPARNDEVEIFLLLPWDLMPECDWRSGVPSTTSAPNELLARVDGVAGKLAQRPLARFVYVPAPIPPIFAAHADADAVAASLTAVAARLGARLLSPSTFSLATYLATGCPFAGNSLTTVAEEVIDALLAPPAGAAKVLVTDLDETLWAGLVSEDGATNVNAASEGRGFRHFVYQTMARSLKNRGVLLAAVSRNDETVAREPLAAGKMVLQDADFVSIKAGYGVKSDHIRAIAQDLNLGLDSFVFVDDNPVELAEVAAALHLVSCVRFPAQEDDLPTFLAVLARAFDRRTLTAEDADRTELYRRRMEALPPPAAGGEQLEDFLAGLSMVLSVHDRTASEWQRAHQLINKTNQFNLNGERMTEEQIRAILATGGRLYAATLEDRTGSHGEILACLVDASGKVRSLVMSCRVFQRRVEYAFLSWLAASWSGPPLTFLFAATDRNEPIRHFLADPSFAASEGGSRLDAAAFMVAHTADAALFKLVTTREEH